MAYSGHIDSTDYAVGMAYIFIHDVTGSPGLASIDEQIASAAYHTHFCVGNTTNVEIAPDITYLDHYISIGGQRRRDKTVTTTSALSVTFTFDQINSTNIRSFMYGELAVSASPTFIVNASPIKEVAAQVYFTTDIGKDFIYKIPKAALKADGGLSFETEDWMTANMMLDVLYDTDFIHNGTSAPYGYINFAATSGNID